MSPTPALRVAAEDFIARHGAPDIVIANAGVSSGTLTECAEDLAVIRRIFEINVLGMAATFSPFIAAMRAAARPGKGGGWSASPRSPAFAACPAPRPTAHRNRQ